MTARLYSFNSKKNAGPYSHFILWFKMARVMESHTALVETNAEQRKPFVTHWHVKYHALCACKWQAQLTQNACMENRNTQQLKLQKTKSWWVQYYLHLSAFFKNDTKTKCWQDVNCHDGLRLLEVEPEEVKRIRVIDSIVCIAAWAIAARRCRKRNVSWHACSWSTSKRGRKDCLPRLL